MNEDREYGRAEAKAFRLLTLRAHSERELRAKLRAGGFADVVIERVIRRCRELGYLNDEAFARQRARVLAVSRFAGDRRIAFDLRERGSTRALCAGDRRGPRGARRGGGGKTAAPEEDPGTAGRRAERTGKGRIGQKSDGEGVPHRTHLEDTEKTEEEGFHDDDGE